MIYPKAKLKTKWIFNLQYLYGCNDKTKLVNFKKKNKIYQMSLVIT